MLNKIIAKIAGLVLPLAVFLMVTGTVYGATTSVRLQQPGTPTNLNSFPIVFVALDLENSPISVQCFKKGPSDGSFVPFGSAIALSAGGNTSNCQTDSGFMNTNGTYQFQAVATGSNTVTSNTVSVNFNNSTSPGTPINYSRTQPDSCTNKISFHTASDNGATVKVVLYRSTDASFSVDSGHQVNSLNIGSNTDGSMTDNVSSNCSATYYYVIRAFDSFGNGSGVIGDSNTVTNITTINPTTTSAQGAIPVGTGGGAVLGAQQSGVGGGTVSGEGTKSAEKQVLGTESAKLKVTPTPVSKNPVSQLATWIMTHKKISLGTLLIILLGAGGYWFYRRNKSA